MGTTNSTFNDKDLRLRGVSVFHLKKVLLKAVQAAGLDVDNATVHDLEPDLKSNDFGLIRRFGANKICPRDGKLGAAYVDCLKGKNHVGRANVMISYSWGYKIKDIVTTLVQKCKKDKRDPKRTYVWICCLCNNQHRIGKVQVPFDEFHDTFYNTVKGVGTLWSMMSPWDKPLYLERVWCVFELHVANTEKGVKSEIIIPEEETNSMMNTIGNVDNLFEALSNTRIKDAKASVPEDKENILALVKDSIGYKERLNNKVNELTREWIFGNVKSEADRIGHRHSNNADDASKLYDIAGVFMRIGDLDTALSIFEQCLAIYEKTLGRRDHPDTAATYVSIGYVMHHKGDYDGALEMFEESLAIREKSLGNDHPSTAESYSNIGGVMKEKGDFDGALEMLEKALEIQEKTLGEDHLETATSYNNIGLLMKQKSDFDGALEMYEKVLAVYIKTLGKDHPLHTATSYNNIGLLMKKKGYFDGALEMYEKGLAVYEKTKGRDHQETASIYNNIGQVMYNKGDYDVALEWFEKALSIQEKTLGNDHPYTVSTRKNIVFLLEM